MFCSVYLGRLWLTNGSTAVPMVVADGPMMWSSFAMRDAFLSGVKTLFSTNVPGPKLLPPDAFRDAFSAALASMFGSVQRQWHNLRDSLRPPF